MNCDETKFLLDGYADGELDLVNHLEFETHINDCPACREIHSKKKFLKSSIADDSFYYRAPDALRQSILADLGTRDEAASTSPGWQWKWWFNWGAASLVTAALAITLFVLWPSRSNSDQLAQELVSSHVRSLMADHIIDVQSSDQHTVKPWFDGRLDFAPPVIDLGPQGFELTGGRLDYAGSRPVAALVYKRRQHIINLFIYPDPDARDEPISSTVKKGYNLVHWNRSGMAFWAVSDLNVDELKQFAQLYQN
jgi:anti-sigma factor RsiW